MFRKLVSNLPFQPTLLSEVVFYLHQFKKEQKLRQLGLVMTSIVVLLQFFTIIYSPKPSLTTSSTDIVYGATSRQDILQAYENNRDQVGRTDIQEIFNYYGISADQIANAKLTTIKNSDDLVSTSRGATQFADTFIEIPGATEGGLYEFPLSYWDTGKFSSEYSALTGISTTGMRFWILLNGSGNIVYAKDARKPELAIVKNRVSGRQAFPSDMVTYIIQFRNQGISDAKEVSITDRLPAELSYKSYSSSLGVSLVQNGQLLTWTIDNNGSVLAPSTRWHTITITTQAQQIESANQLVCNTSIIAAINSNAESINPESERCVSIVKPVCPGTGTDAPAGGLSQCLVMCSSGTTVSYSQQCPISQLTCQSLRTVSEPAWNARKFETTILMQQGSVPKTVTYFVNDSAVATLPLSSNSNAQYYTHTFPSNGMYKIRSEITASTGLVQASQNCTVTETIEKSMNPITRINTDKKVTNLTQKIGDANNTTAYAGDILRYTLIISNTGDVPVDNLTMSGEYGESIADIMEYANLTDKGDAFYNESTKYLTWAPVDIASGASIEKTFTVTIKNPIPATPISASNPLSFDYTLYNKYGRSVVVNLDKPITKVIEQATATLPKTGAGASMVVSMLCLLVIGFFFYRSKLIVTELTIIQRDFSSGGL